MEYAPALIQSAIDAKENIHINVVNPDTPALNLLLMAENKKKKSRLTFSLTYVSFPPGVKEKVYYCCDRFLLAADLLARQPKLRLMTIDIDSLIVKRMPELDCDLGLWLRPEEGAGMKLLAGMCYFTINSIDILYNAIKKMEAGKFDKWFLDQHALYEAFTESKITDIKIKDLRPEKLMDWNTEDISSPNLWTAKGPRKSAELYVQEKERLTRKFYGKS